MTQSLPHVAPHEQEVAREALKRGIVSRAQLDDALRSLANRPDGSLLEVLRARCAGPEQAAALEQTVRAVQAQAAQAGAGQTWVARPVGSPSGAGRDAQRAAGGAPQLRSAAGSQRAAAASARRAGGAPERGAAVAGAEPSRAELAAAFRRALAAEPRFAPHADAVFERLEELGAGGMGVVYRVLDRRLGRQAALKVMRDEGPEAVTRFWREAEITARLDHPSVPPVYEAGTDGAGRHYLLMRVIEGETLAARIRAFHERGGTARGPLAALLEALVKVGEAVAYAHGRGVVHRDLKPQNVLVGRFGEVMVLDWGLARDLRQTAEDDAELRRSWAGEGLPGPALLPSGLGPRAAATDEAAPRPSGGGDELTQAGTILGTLGYMAPEQAAGTEVGEAADVFALGAILVAVLTERPPIEGSSQVNQLLATAEGRAVLPRARRPDVSAELHDLAAAALALDPSGRPSAARFVAELRAYLAGDELATHRYGPWERLLRSARRRPAALVAGAALVGLGAIASAAGLLLVQERMAAAMELQRAQAVAVEDRIRAQSVAEEATRRARAEAAEDARREHVAAARAAYSAERERAAGETGGGAAAGALATLQAAQRWHLVGGPDPEATRAYHDAALELAVTARRGEQWELALWACDLAADLGVDPGAAVAARAQVEAARDAEASRRMAEVEALLDRAESGALSREPDGIRDAVFVLVRLAEPAVIARVIERLDGVTRAMEAASRRPDAPQDAVARGAFLRDQVGEGALALAQLACEALGRSGHGGAVDEGAVEALGRHLAAEVDELRAVHAGLALVQLGGERASALLDKAYARFERRGIFTRRTVDAAAARGRSTTAPPRGDEAGVDTLAAAGRLRVAGDLEGARAGYDRVIARDPECARAWGMRGGVRRRLGDLEGALSDANRAVALDPQDALLLASRGATRAAVGDQEGAIADLTRALELQPLLASAWSDRGITRRWLGDHEGALADFSRAVELEPQLVHAWTGRGQARHALGDIVGALADYERALELDPRFAEIWSSRGAARHSLGDLDGAILDGTRAIELDPGLAWAWHRRGLARLGRGDRVGAAADFTRSLELNSANSEALLRRSGIRRALGDAPGALADATGAIELDPANAEAWLARSAARLVARDLEAAIADAGRAIELDPQSALAWATRAAARWPSGDPEGAVADSTRAIELQPGLPQAWGQRGYARIELGDPAGAADDLERFLELAPSTPSAERVRATVRRLRAQAPH